MRAALYAAGAILATLLIWQGVVWAFALPHYILPAPADVARAFADNFGEIGNNALITLTEIVFGQIGRASCRERV